MERSRTCSVWARASLCHPRRTRTQVGTMDIYASLARQHMRIHGTTARQIAAAACKKPLHVAIESFWLGIVTICSIDDMMRERHWPLTRAMCAPNSDSAGSHRRMFGGFACALRPRPMRSRCWRQGLGERYKSRE